MPVSEMKYSDSRVVSPRKYEPIIAAPITRADQTVDSRPIENPDRIVVAGPVTVEAAISCTGLYFVSVKYCVIFWITEASTRPISTATPGLYVSM